MPHRSDGGETVRPGEVAVVQETAGGSRGASERHAPKTDGTGRPCLRPLSPPPRADKRFEQSLPGRPALSKTSRSPRAEPESLRHQDANPRECASERHSRQRQRKETALAGLFLSKPR